MTTLQKSFVAFVFGVTVVSSVIIAVGTIWMTAAFVSIMMFDMFGTFGLLIVPVSILIFIVSFLKYQSLVTEE